MKPDEKPIGVLELQKKLTELRGRKTHRRLVTKAMASGLPWRPEPLNGKPVFFWSEVEEWWIGRLSTTAPNPAADARREAGRIE